MITIGVTRTRALHTATAIDDATHRRVATSQVTSTLAGYPPAAAVGPAVS